MTEQTHCRNGHEFTPENTYIARRTDGTFKQRVCRACTHARGRAHDARRAARERITVPAFCAGGHELTARTVHVTTRMSDKSSDQRVPASVECLRCLRVECYRAHHGRNAEIPTEILDEDQFIRQASAEHRPAPRGEAWPTTRGWWTKVEFASGWGFTDPDPTTELRAAREAARSAAIARELEELELKDARLRRDQRRDQRRQATEASTAAIRAAMTAARGGVAV